MAGGHLLTTASPYHRPSHHQNRSSHSQYLLSVQSVLKANAALLALGIASAEALPHYIPGFKTSATFLSSLRANLCISEFEDECQDTSSLCIAKAKPKRAAAPTISFADSHADKDAALALIRHSVAEQRHTACRALLTHPLNMLMPIIIAAMAYMLLHDTPRAGQALLSAVMGTCLAYYATLRLITNQYAVLANQLITPDWLGSDLVMVAKSNEQVVGALVLQWGTANATRGRGRKRALKGVARAWAVAAECRGQGYGRKLLEQAAAYVHDKGGETLDFESKGIYSQRILPAMYNRFLDARDALAQAVLEAVVKKQFPVSRRRNSY